MTFNPQVIPSPQAPMVPDTWGVWGQHPDLSECRLEFEHPRDDLCHCLNMEMRFIILCYVYTQCHRHGSYTCTMLNWSLLDYVKISHEQDLSEALFKVSALNHGMV